MPTTTDPMMTYIMKLDYVVVEDGVVGVNPLAAIEYDATLYPLIVDVCWILEEMLL